MTEPAADSAASAKLTAVRRFGPVGCVTLAFFVVALLVVALLFGWRAAGERRAEAELAKIRERGQPITAEEMNVFYAAPPAELDCTQLWVTALRPLQGTSFGRAAEKLPLLDAGPDIPPPGQPWPQLAAVERFLKRYDRSMRRLHEAASLGGAARYDLDFHQGISMGLLNVKTTRNAARMLTLEAQVRAHLGDAPGAADSVDVIFKLGVSLQNEPIMITQLARVTLDGVAREQLQGLLPHVEFADEDLHRWRKDLQRIDYDRGLHRALLGERFFGVVRMENSGDFRGWLDDGNPVSRITPGEDLATYLTLMGRMADAAERPWPAVRDEAAAVHDEVNSLAGGGGLSQLRYSMTANLLSEMEAVVQRVACGGSQNDAADAALAVELFRRRHGRLPADLNELAPELLKEVPLDRIDGQPLRYVVREGECVIYSVGENGLDDGGNIDIPTDGGLPTDWGFRLSIPAAGE